MFTAFIEHTTTVVNLWHEKRQNRTREDIHKRKYVCKHCGSPLVAKVGPVKVWHFAHRPNPECLYLRDKGGESKLHRDLKQLLADTFYRKYEGHKPVVKFEERIPATQRIADVLLDFPGGQQLALEAQVSNISMEQLKARTLDYESQDIDVIWVFKEWEPGEKTAREIMTNWLLEQGYQVVTFRTREVKELL